MKAVGLTPRSGAESCTNRLTTNLPELVTVFQGPLPFVVGSGFWDRSS